MKTVLILVVTLWTLSNIVHAGLLDNCTTVNNNAYCKNTTGDPNAVCTTAGSKCTCAPAFKENAGKDGCVAKVLDDPCTGNASCAGITKAFCKVDKCACPPGYFSGSACVKIIGGTCTDVNNCAGVQNSKCDKTKCTCNDGFRDIDDLCKPTFGSNCSAKSDCNDATAFDCTGGKCVCAANYASKGNNCYLKVTATKCSSSVKCSVEHAVCNTTSMTCKCDAGYVEKANTCEKSGNGVSSLTANIWILCSMLVMFDYLMKF